MLNSRKSGQILRSKKRPRPTLRSGRGSRTNFHTSHQVPGRVIEADSARAVWVPDPRSVQLIQPGRSCGRYHSSFNWFRGDRNITFAVCQPWCGRRLTRGASNMTEALAGKTCTPCRGGIPPLTREQAELFHAQAPRLATGGGSSPHRAELPVSQFPRAAYLPSKYPRISSRLRSLEA